MGRKANIAMTCPQCGEMGRNPRLQRRAELDLAEAARFFRREGGRAVAARFLDEFERVAEVLVEHPGIGTGGIRARVCRAAVWLGIELDQSANAGGGPRISRASSRASAWVLPTNEELMIALHTRAALAVTD